VWKRFVLSSPLLITSFFSENARSAVHARRRFLVLLHCLSGHHGTAAAAAAAIASGFEQGPAHFPRRLFLVTFPLALFL
jgi:hypothetical protein